VNEEIVREESDCSIPVFIIRPERLDVNQVWQHVGAASDIIILNLFLDTLRLGDN